MAIKIGINGLGRIGRMIIRSLIENNNNKIEIKHINSRSSAEVISSLLKFDSIHGRFNCKIEHGDDYFIINGKRIKEIKWKTDVILYLN